MRIRQFGNIYQLAFLPTIFPINCYLVDEGVDLTLIDTGMAFCTKGILQVIKRLNKPLARIALTHPHVDHIGSLDAIKAAFPAAQVYVSRRDAGSPVCNVRRIKRRLKVVLTNMCRLNQTIC